MIGMISKFTSSIAVQTACFAPFISTNLSLSAACRSFDLSLQAFHSAMPFYQAMSPPPTCQE
jgi:hypothetical protein